MYKEILFALLIGFNLFMIAKAEGSQTTFQDCYSNFAGRLLLASMLTPTSLNLADSEIKQYISNVCNFIHEKTGVWNDFSVEPDPQLIKEFLQTHEIPQSLRQFGQSIN